MIDLSTFALESQIVFDNEGKKKLIEWLSRAANTHTTDKELINLLDELKK